MEDGDLFCDVDVCPGLPWRGKKTEKRAGHCATSRHLYIIVPCPGYLSHLLTEIMHILYGQIGRLKDIVYAP